MKNPSLKQDLAEALNLGKFKTELKSQFGEALGIMDLLVPGLLEKPKPKPKPKPKSKSKTKAKIKPKSKPKKKVKKQVKKTKTKSKK